MKNLSKSLILNLCKHNRLPLINELFNCKKEITELKNKYSDKDKQDICNREINAIDYLLKIHAS